MGIKHIGVMEWERKLKTIFDAIDDDLEARYGTAYPLHPARARRGKTSNKEQDGLFNVGAAFSAGFGSREGAGYVLEVRMSTLSNIDQGLKEQIEQEVVNKLNECIPQQFPGKNVSVKRDGNVYKICGDLSW